MLYQIYINHKLNQGFVSVTFYPVDPNTSDDRIPEIGRHDVECCEVKDVQIVQELAFLIITLVECGSRGVLVLIIPAKINRVCIPDLNYDKIIFTTGFSQ